MALSFFNVLSAMFFTMAASNMGSVFGPGSFCIHFLLIAVIYEALRGEFHVSILFVLFLGFFGDSMASGPPGLFFLLITGIYFLFFVLSRRFRGGNVIILMLIFSTAGSIIFDTGYGLLLSIVYSDSLISTMITDVVWRDAVATGIMGPVVVWLQQVIEKVWMARVRARRKL